MNFDNPHLNYVTNEIDTAISSNRPSKHDCLEMQSMLNRWQREITTHIDQYIAEEDEEKYDG